MLQWIPLWLDFASKITGFNQIDYLIQKKSK